MLGSNPALRPITIILCDYTTAPFSPCFGRVFPFTCTLLKPRISEAIFWLRATAGLCFGIISWSGWQDLNPRPHGVARVVRYYATARHGWAMFWNNFMVGGGMGIRTPDKLRSLYTLSKRAPSTTRTPLHRVGFILSQIIIGCRLFCHTYNTSQGKHRVVPISHCHRINTHHHHGVIIAARLSHIAKIQNIFTPNF